MTNSDKILVSVQVGSDDPIKHLNAHDGYITIENDSGLTLRTRPGCKPLPVPQDEQQCCDCLTVLRGQETLNELSGSSLGSITLDFEDHYLVAHFLLPPEHALTLVDMLSPDISIDVFN